MKAFQHQRGQRNVTEAENNYLLGKEYEAQKQARGGDRKSESFSKGLKGHLKTQTAQAEKCHTSRECLAVSTETNMLVKTAAVMTKVGPQDNRLRKPTE